MCHQPTGTGVPPVYPPLAGSDWLAGHRAEAIKAVCEGLSGPLTVGGQAYDNLMPAQMLDDAQAAAVLSYVGTAWGNKLQPFSAREVSEARQTTRFPTFELLTKASAFAPLPKAPAGWTVREVVQLPEFCTRLARLGDGSALALAQKGNVYQVDGAARTLALRIPAAAYLEPERGDPVTMGLTLDSDGRLYIVANRRMAETRPMTNEVSIYRTPGPLQDSGETVPRLWLRTSYPYGIGPYNHGVSHMAFGPDGMLYVNSGSRTDGGEAGTDPRFYEGGEVDLTACLWRIDPHAAEPKIEVWARGIRNAYGFAWDGAGRLFSVANGPDANAPEEMDYVRQGRHYGFPFQFSDWPVEAGRTRTHRRPRLAWSSPCR